MATEAVDIFTDVHGLELVSLENTLENISTQIGSESVQSIHR
jgi:hypothetical protein